MGGANFISIPSQSLLSTVSNPQSNLESKLDPLAMMMNHGMIVQDQTHRTHTSQLFCISPYLYYYPEQVTKRAPRLPVLLIAHDSAESYERCHNKNLPQTIKHEQALMYKIFVLGLCQASATSLAPGAIPFAACCLPLTKQVYSIFHLEWLNWDS